MNHACSKEDVERVVRMYKNTGDAARALGITPRTLIDRCNQYGLPTPTKKARIKAVSQ